jgi:hypothetical protein
VQFADTLVFTDTKQQIDAAETKKVVKGALFEQNQ